MPSKIIATSAFYTRPTAQKGLKNTLRRPRAQRGVTLVELMVGISIGLLVVAVAMGALMVSRGISGSVSDASSIQQQAASAMRVIGLQLRQAGSLYLNPNPANAASYNVSMAPVAFETMVPASGSANGFNPTTDTLSGTQSPVALTVGYRRYTESVHTSATAIALARNCVGLPADASDDQRVESVFALDGTNLRCAGNGAAAQPIAQNVANFQVRYLLQDLAEPGNAKIRYVTADNVDIIWARVQAVEVCLVLFGAEPIDMPAGSTYTDCDGAAVDMTTLTAPRARRMHIMFRNVFQMRSQGLIGTVL